MTDKPCVYVVGARCAPELEAKLNKWYHEVHIPMLLKSEHLLGVTRYKLSSTNKADSPKYLVNYEFKDRQGYEAWYASSERIAASAERENSWKGKETFEVIWQALYEPIQTWSKGKK